MCFLEVCKYIVIENKISIYINDDKEIFLMILKTTLLIKRLLMNKCSCERYYILEPQIRNPDECGLRFQLWYDVLLLSEAKTKHENQ